MRTPIVAPDTTRNRPRKTRLGGPYDFTRRVIATEAVGALHSRRQWMVEPVFAQIQANRRIERFKRSGRPDRVAERPLPFSDRAGFTAEQPGSAGFTRHPRRKAEARLSIQGSWRPKQATIQRPLGDGI
jgi:hypothetical protein